jgi:hypothetical protein
MIRSIFCPQGQGGLNKDLTIWLDGAGPANQYLYLSLISLRKHPHSCQAYPPPKFIAQSDNTFGGLPDFSSQNLLEVENFARNYLAVVNWEKVKTRKKYIDGGVENHQCHFHRRHNWSTVSTD